MQVFDTTPREFFNDIGQNIVSQQNYEGAIGYAIGYVDTLQQENKEANQKIILTLEQENVHLKEEIAFLRKMVDK
jgi:hypothetical protein